MTWDPTGRLAGFLGLVLLCCWLVASAGSAVSSGRYAERRLAGRRSTDRRPAGRTAGFSTRFGARLGSRSAAGRAAHPDRGDRMDLETAAGLTDRLAALLEAGLPVRECWLILAEPGSGTFDPATVRTARVARTVADVVTSGGSVGDGLRLAARAGSPPGRRPSAVAGRMFGRRRPPDGLSWLATVWDVTHESGAAPSGVLRAVARSLRDERDLRAAVETAAAGPRATVLVLAGMPPAVSALGGVLGADPVHVLFGTAAGRVCLVAGVALWAVGLFWAYRLTDPR